MMDVADAESPVVPAAVTALVTIVGNNARKITRTITAPMICLVVSLPIVQIPPDFVKTNINYEFRKKIYSFFTKSIFIIFTNLYCFQYLISIVFWF